MSTPTVDFTEIAGSSTRAADVSATVQARRRGSGAELVTTATGVRGGKREIQFQMGNAARRALIVALGGTPND